MAEEETPISGYFGTAPGSVPDDIRAPPDLVIPTPRKFMPASGQFLNVLTAEIPMLIRLFAATFTSSYSLKLLTARSLGPHQYAVGPFLGWSVVEQSHFSRRPAKPIILFEFESCPYCRKVREAVSALDLDVLIYPCPRGGPRFRPEAIARGGKRQFPYMVDPNTGVSMYESSDIIEYLAENYGDGRLPLMLRLGFLTDLSVALASLLRLSKGSKYVPAKQPQQPLELWAYEDSPFSKIVREALTELELPHLYHSTARGSIKRSELIQRTGRFQVPYLEDPNTGVKMFESKNIVDYLHRTYRISKEE